MFDFMSAPTLATSLLNKFSVGRITWARASWCKIVVSEFLPLQFPEGGDFFYVALNEIGCSDVKSVDCHHIMTFVNTID